MTAEDTYKTITEPSEGIYTEKRSKFIAIALPVRTIDEIKVHLETYQKKYYDARHVCYESLPVRPVSLFSDRLIPMN